MDSIVQLSRYLFSLKFKHYSTIGNQSFQKCNPIIYVNSSHSNSIYGHVCHQLGIPLSSIHYVPSLTNYGKCLKYLQITLDQKLFQHFQ